jgi:hypothetical protein
VLDLLGSKATCCLAESACCRVALGNSVDQT